MAQEWNVICGASCLGIPLQSLMDPDPSQWQQGLLTAQLGKREKSLCVTSRALRKKLFESTWLQSDGRRWVWGSQA